MILNIVRTQRSLFQYVKEIFRFVMTTIVVANACKSSASAASIIANYHKIFAARSNRRGAAANTKYISNSARGIQLRKDMNSINLWNLRSTSTLQLPPPDFTMTASAASSSASESSLDKIATCTTRHNKGSRRRNVDDVDMISVTSTSNKVVEPLLDPNYGPSYQGMRAQLPPIVRLMLNSLEIGIITGGSYVSGGLFGYVVGGVMGTPNLFRNSQGFSKGSPPNQPSVGLPTNIGEIPPANGFQEMKNRIGNWNSKALSKGNTWGQLSAAYSGFHALTKVCRGGVEDKWNGIIGSALTGAYVSREGGPQAMFQGATTYAGFTYLIDTFFGAQGGRNGQLSGLDRDFDFKDTSVSQNERGF